MIKIAIYKVSCRACGEGFSALSLKKAKDEHQRHVRKCKVLRFWKKANKILGQELTLKEVAKLLGHSGFVITKVVSTLFQKPEAVTEMESPQEGFHPGAGFTVVAANKPPFPEHDISGRRR